MNLQDDALKALIIGLGFTHCPTCRAWRSGGARCLCLRPRTPSFPVTCSAWPMPFFPSVDDSDPLSMCAHD
jgi:hypothetical protein